MHLLDRVYRLFSPRFEEPLYPAPTAKFWFRPYEPRDRNAVLAIYDAVAPGHFPSDGRLDFVEFLDGGCVSYFVAENDRGEVIASGGISSVGHYGHLLMYGMVAPAWQSQRVGTALTYARIVFAMRREGWHITRIYTLPRSIKFYERFGLFQYGEAHFKDGPFFPVSANLWHTNYLGHIRKTLRRRGHIINPDWPIECDKTRRLVIKPLPYSSYSWEIIDLATGHTAEQGTTPPTKPEVPARNAE